ncbi:hypothetical protein C0995_009967 [Termitomyces sp. Mi166|nr:hypothetical protein C0995_009967 [Termitomyces sp. Mi166\
MEETSWNKFVKALRKGISQKVQQGKEFKDGVQGEYDDEDGKYNCNKKGKANSPEYDNNEDEGEYHDKELKDEELKGKEKDKLKEGG